MDESRASRGERFRARATKYCGWWVGGLLYAAAPVAAAHADVSTGGEAAAPSLFLNCPLECFDGYLRQELSYFDFSNDPYRAEITIVVVRQKAGNGGERFTITMSRRGSSTTKAAISPMAFTVPAGTPDAVARKNVLQKILRMLKSDLEGTPHEAAFELHLPKRNGETLSHLVDRWKYWVIAPEIRGEGEGGSGYYYVDVEGAVIVRRITDLQKIRLRAAYSRQWSGYLLEDGSRVRGDVDRWDVRGLYAHTIEERWALGAIATVRASEFENLEGHVHGGILAEVNIFPYSDNAAKQLRFAYQVGHWANWYIEKNRQGLLHETRGYHAFSIIADLNQRWGSVQWIGQVNHFLDDSRQYRLSTGAVLAVRLFAGLALSLEGEAALVRDLVNLRRRAITDRELLLWTVEQPTGYRFEAGLVLTYTFGSTHNTIVNPRFARVDLDEE